MVMMNMFTPVRAIVALFILGLSCAPVAAHNHAGADIKGDAHTGANADEVRRKPCTPSSIDCAKTVTVAFAPNGDLWRLWSHDQRLYFDISGDSGKSFSAVKKVMIMPEKILARNENRPKIAFDNRQGVYLSWASPREKKYTADVRFSYSANYGVTFTAPVTVNDDNLLAGHSFNEMLVNDRGEVTLVWLDSRFSKRSSAQKNHSIKLKAGAINKNVNGSALFLARANPAQQQAFSTNQLLANGTCVCCRIATDYNRQGDVAILWRHIYGDNIREFALLTVEQAGTTLPVTPHRVSYDHWKINGCPHQGGALSVDGSNRYHLVWFNQGSRGQGIFYAASVDQGKTLSKPLAIGRPSAQAAHPFLLANNENLDIVWREFNGIEHQLWHQRSLDGGKSFQAGKVLTTAINGPDRPFIIKYQGNSYVSWQRPGQGHWLQLL